MAGLSTKPSTDAADPVSAANAMTNEKRTFWQQYRMPIILGVIAVCLYVGSIIWMVYGRGQVG